MLSFPVTVTDRQWMRAAKAWRARLELPSGNTMLPVQLSAMIERQVWVTLETDDGNKLEIRPCQIVDVPHKGKKFWLVVETVYENQKAVGPYLTDMVGKLALIKIQPLQASDEAPTATQAPTEGNTPPAMLAALHTRWFKNEKFWAYISEKALVKVSSPEECKKAFKQYMQIGSCRDLTQAAFSAMVTDFNQYLSGRR